MTKHADLTREEQITDALKVTAALREQGWAVAFVEVTRGGTFKVHAEANGDKVARPVFGTGRGK
jgi:hypothetical protein